MELVYIWGKLKNDIAKNKPFEINLANNYLFHYNEDKMEIESEENNGYLANFFDEHINITALIGKNGSGKTTTLSNIKHSIIDDFAYDKVIKIYKKSNLSYIVYWKGLSTLRFLEGEKIFASKSFLKTQFGEIGELSDILSGVIIENENILSLISQPDISIDDFPNCVELNNIYQKKDFNSDNSKMYFDLTLSGFRYQALGTSFLLEIIKRTPDYTSSRLELDYFNIYRLNEIKYQIKFIQDYPKAFINLLPFKLPDKINITLLYFITPDNHAKVSKTHPEAWEDDSVVNTPNYDEKLRIWQDVYQKHLEPHFHDENSPLNSFYIPIEEFVAFVDSYGKSIIQKDYLTFNYNLSSGEFYMLSIFSRLFSISQKGRDGNSCLTTKTNSKDFTLLLDECDLYFHPEWQQQFVKSLIDFLPSIFINSEIHIVLATHSPIVLSDIPKSNIAFLEQSKTESGNYIQGEYKQISSKERQETFFANISSLFHNTLSLEKGSIGKFAKEKIDSIIKALCPKKNDVANPIYPQPYEVLDALKSNGIYTISELQNTINLIGEPILRNKLLGMLDMCLFSGYSLEEKKKRLTDEYNRKLKELELSEGDK